MLLQLMFLLFVFFFCGGSPFHYFAHCILLWTFLDRAKSLFIVLCPILNLSRAHCVIDHLYCVSRVLHCRSVFNSTHLVLPFVACDFNNFQIDSFSFLLEGGFPLFYFLVQNFFHIKNQMFSTVLHILIAPIHICKL